MVWFTEAGRVLHWRCENIGVLDVDIIKKNTWLIPWPSVRFHSPVLM